MVKVGIALRRHALCIRAIVICNATCGPFDNSIYHHSSCGTYGYQTFHFVTKSRYLYCFIIIVSI
jgi:hypothetical protein